MMRLQSLKKTQDLLRRSFRGSWGLFFRDSAIYSSERLLKKVAGLILIPVLTSFLSPDEFGVLNTVGVTVSLLFLVGNTGVNDAVNRFYFKLASREKSDFLTTSLVIALTGTSTISITIFFLAEEVAELLFNSSRYFYAVEMISIMLPLQFLITFDRAIYRLSRRPKKLLFNSVIYAVLNLSFTYILVAVFELGIRGALWASVSTSAVYLIISFFSFVRTQLALSFKKKWVSMVLLYGYPYIFTRVAEWVYLSSDRVFLAKYSSLDEVGYYSLASSLTQPISIINMAIAMSFSVTVYSLFESEDSKAKAKTRDFISKSWRLYLIGALLLLTSLTIWGKEIILLISNEAYLITWIAIPFQSLFLILTQSGYMLGRGLDFHEKSKMYLLPMLSAAGLNLLLNFLWIPEYGLLGALGSTLLSQAIHLLLLVRFSQSLFALKMNYFKIFSALALAFSVCLAIPFLDLYYEVSFSVLTRVGLSIALFFIYFMALKRVVGSNLNQVKGFFNGSS